MRVLHINSTSHTGGAARAMQRLHGALLKQGHESQFLVGRTRFAEDPSVHTIWDEIESYRSLKSSIKSRIGNHLEKLIGLHHWANEPNLRIVDTSLIQWADIIDLRNLFGGFFNLWVLPTLSANKAVVWRLPDLWAITGHCAYPYDCERWKTGCYRCPLLTKDGRKKVEPTPTILDGTRSVWNSKKRIYAESKLHIIVTTKWMRKQVSESILKNALSVNVISNGVDLEVFKPTDKKEARDKLNLPQSQKILLWAAGGKGNYRKGYHLTIQALETIQARTENPPLLVTMGSEEGWDKLDSLRNILHFGYIREPERQALIYSAVDAFICSTLADGQPQTALESLACGTPVIAFDLGPMPELVIPSITGYLASTPTKEGLMDSIEEFLRDRDNWIKMQENCRQKAFQEYNLEKQTQMYIDLYKTLIVNDGK